MAEYGRIHTDGSRSGGQPVIKTQHCPNCEAQAAEIERLRDLLCKLIWSDCYGIKDDMMANGCSHGFKPASSCPNAECKKGELEREIDAALEQSK